MVKVTTPYRTLAGPTPEIVADSLTHENGVAISVNPNSELVVKDKDQNTIALYANGQWARAVKE